MGVTNKLNKLGLCSPLDKADQNLNFSLIDYRNNYFTSNDPNKIIEFYNGFENRDQLIQWMRERPKGIPIIYEVEGDKDIIVVIPTANFNGKYAKECREIIFKGLHMVFVGSGGKGDFYFNFSHYVNTGLKKAMEYNPKWIIYSGDDMGKIDEISKLKKELLEIDYENVSAVFTAPSPTKYHSMPSLLGKPNFLGKLYYAWCQRTGIAPYDFWVYLYKGKGILDLRREIILLPSHFISRIFFQKRKKIIMTMSFAIFSSKFIMSKKGNVLNESFINGCDDWDISYRLCKEDLVYSFIDYQIKEKSGGTLGTGGNRSIRDDANVIYFNSIYRKDFS